jgi:hypothetical protein
LLLRFELLRWCQFALVYALLAQPLIAQKPPSEWAGRLTGHPLYLRGAWTEDKIDFDAAGKPTSPAHPGSLTLSGIEITSVKLSGHSLVLHGERVALVSSAPGEPLRRVAAVSSTTQMPFTLRHKDFKANEPVQFTILADAQGSFSAALDAIFADGMAQLAVSVPAYWRCYASAYFVDGPPASTAAQDVLQCAQSQSKDVQSISGMEPAGFTPLEVVQSASPAGTSAAAELHITNVCRVYATITRHGTPSDFQVLSPVGGGLDEVALDALAHSTFRPATLDGKPVPAGFEYSLRISPD